MEFPVVIAILVMLVVAGEGRAPVLHRVGGDKYGWRFHVNFSNWSSHQRFFVGDWLYFGFDKHTFSVLEVNKTSYQNCIEKNFITNITRGGRDVFNLTVARPYYFISGRGYCSRGVKVSIKVFDAPPDLPINNNSLVKESPTTSDATTNSSLFRPVYLISLIAVALAWTFDVSI